MREKNKPFPPPVVCGAYAGPIFIFWSERAHRKHSRRNWREYGMYKRSCLATVIGIAFLAVSAAVPDKAFAATADYTTEGAKPLDPASQNIEQQRYAQRRGGGRRSGGGGGRSREARPSSRSRGARPSSRPSNRPSGRPGAGPGRPGGGRNVNINRNVNVTVKHRGYGWRGARWGAVVFGVTLGTAIVVAANTPPYPPDPSLCWTWSNAALTRGYWYYCTGP